MSSIHPPAKRIDSLTGVPLRDTSKAAMRARLLAISNAPISAPIPPNLIATNSPIMNGQIDTVSRTGVDCNHGPVKTIYMPDKSIMQIRPQAFVNPLMNDQQHNRPDFQDIDGLSYFAKPVYTTDDGSIVPLSHANPSISQISSVDEADLNRLKFSDLHSPHMNDFSPQNDLSDNSKHKIRFPTDQRNVIQMRQIYAAMASLAVIGLLAAIMSILTLQLIMALRSCSIDQSVISRQMLVIMDVSSCFSMVGLTLSLTSLFTSFVQLYLSCKLIKLSPGSSVRILLYLQHGIYLRFVTYCGLFLSIPMYIIAVILYIAMQASTAAMIVTVIIGTFGTAVCIITAGQSGYAWLAGVLRLEPREIVQPKSKDDLLVIDTKLSTLV